MSGCAKFQTKDCRKCNGCFIFKVNGAGDHCSKNCVSSFDCRYCENGTKATKTHFIEKDAIETDWDTTDGVIAIRSGEDDTLGPQRYRKNFSSGMPGA
jgi:hypothetical protein